ncbi:MULTISPECIES: hypothetical protein [Haloarcula]|jgi:hypothetical protein|uniref:Uncharacterized protein n=4 Tax=Haloarcula TaxID=2237 RepID=A0A495R9Y9_9EURY|nr:MULTISPECIES: hypothetical protein [Haloarcula]AUG46416.1 hypothetical protein BVU17_02345 [Haloarcula taiwanensis]KAA9408105.1 hypothetical protein Har1131_15260 [Haloarcula sp. CBA1131]KZX49519.1 hypothetical protein AV929_17545 [Haloarcula sp. K1]MCJ0620866.1 hypothetical protein [Haloarcula hispanica]MUV50195.1 hypothetical protein [Haloarcula sp. CBA1122]
MALQVSERNAAIGASAAAGLPVLMSAGGINIEDRLVDVSNAVFEGDLGSASMVTGGAFSLIGLGLIAAAWVGPLRGSLGMLAIGIGIGFAMLGVQSFDAARRAN